MRALANAVHSVRIKQHVVIEKKRQASRGAELDRCIAATRLWFFLLLTHLPIGGWIVLPFSRWNMPEDVGNSVMLSKNVAALFVALRDVVIDLKPSRTAF